MPTRRMLAAALIVIAAQACAQTVISETKSVEPGPYTLTERASHALPFAMGVHGISALAFDNAPDRLIAFSDRGDVHRLALRFGDDGRLESIQPIAKKPVKTTAQGVDETGDVESAVRLSRGDWLLGLERPHRLVRFSPGDLETFATVTERWTLPPELSLLAPNAGIEAIAELDDGRILLISEGIRSDGQRIWIGASGDWSVAAYRTVRGFAPVDAARHPCGGLLILERAATIFRGLTARLVYLSDEQIRRAAAGEFVVPQPIGPIEPEAGTGNFEGLVVVPNDQQGDTCQQDVDILVATDDNFLRIFSRVVAHYRLSTLPTG